MLAKLTSKNQITLPKAILKSFPTTEYFEVTAEDGIIRLAPVRISRASAVRAKLSELGITEQDVADAVSWVREN